jgi:hypothetical protein
MILINGDSFTAGDELLDRFKAWPYSLPHNVTNVAQPGFSNDAIVRTTVKAIDYRHYDYAIIAWTTPHRIEINGQHLTPTSHKRYGSICDLVFLDWDEKLAIEKFHTQVALLDSYLRDKKIPYIFVRTFDVPDSSIGNWVDGQMVEWMGDCVKGPGGHPLELGHQRIADKIYEHIRNLGWIS